MVRYFSFRFLPYSLLPLELTHERVTSELELVIELRRFCGNRRAVPPSYTLNDVVKEEDKARHISEETEIWKGRYGNKVVALKVPVVEDWYHEWHITRWVCRVMGVEQVRWYILNYHKVL